MVHPSKHFIYLHFLLIVILILVVALGGRGGAVCSKLCLPRD